jgi:hypothetical protein
LVNSRFLATPTARPKAKKSFTSRRNKGDFEPARVTRGGVGAPDDTHEREIPSQGSRYRSAAPSRRVSAHLWCAPCADHSEKTDPFGLAHISERAQLLNDPSEENRLRVKTPIREKHDESRCTGFWDVRWNSWNSRELAEWLLQLDVCFVGATVSLFPATTCDAADSACLLRVQERAFRRITHLQTLDGGLTGLRLIFVSALERTRFCKISSRTGRTTGAPRRDATASRREKLDTSYHVKAFLSQVCRVTRRRRAE